MNHQYCDDPPQERQEKVDGKVPKRQTKDSLQH